MSSPHNVVCVRNQINSNGVSPTQSLTCTVIRGNIMLVLNALEIPGGNLSTVSLMASSMYFPFSEETAFIWLLPACIMYIGRIRWSLSSGCLKWRGLSSFLERGMNKGTYMISGFVYFVAVKMGENLQTMWYAFHDNIIVIMLRQFVTIKNIAYPTTLQRMDWLIWRMAAPADKASPNCWYQNWEIICGQANKRTIRKYDHKPL